MSFVKTLATLAVGFAAAKGYDKFKDMGGMPGVKEAMQSNPAMKTMSDQALGAMEKMGLPTEQLRQMSESFLGNAGGGGATMAGLGGLMGAMTGGMAATAGGAASMMDAMTGTTAATDAMEENAKLMIRAMIQSAKADGEIDAEERAKIMEYMGDLDEDEKAFVLAEMDAPVDPMALATDAGEQVKGQVYAAALITMRVDTVAEARYLDQLAAALGLSEEARERIHTSMGVT